MKRAVVSLAFGVACAAAAFAQSEWPGTYTFEEDGGKNAGGTAILIVHELNVMETDDRLEANAAEQRISIVEGLELYCEGERK